MEFLSSVNSLGTVPLLILIVVIFILLFREVKKDNERTSARLEAHEAKMDKQMKEHRESVDKQISMQNRTVEKMEERLRAVEQDYATKTYVQEVVSGWREEIRRLNDKLDRMYEK